MHTLPDLELPIWREIYPVNSLYNELKGEIKVDVAVIGAGITGLTTAYLLKQSGLKVAVLEKDSIGSGTTGRTTGKVTSQHNLIYDDMVARLGKMPALAYAHANQTAVKKIEAIIRKESIECDWKKSDNYIFTTKKDQINLLRKEAAAAARLGLPASFVTDSSLPFDIKGAVKFTNQAKFHSQKYLFGLAKSIHTNGSFVFEDSKATHFKDGTPCRVNTEKGSIIAKSIVVATKIPTFPLIGRIGYASLEYPTESFGVAVELKQKLSCMYISPDKSHHSILPIKTGGRPMLIVVGAGGNIPGIRISKDERCMQLVKYADKHFNIGRVTHKWSDMDYLPYDGYPLIGKLYPWSKNIYTATGYMKWGLTNGTVAAMILRDLIIGNDNKWTKFFDSNRTRPIKNIPRAIIKHFS